MKNKLCDNDETKQKESWWHFTIHDLESCVVVLFLMFILFMLSLFLIVMILSELHIINV